jgi:serine/threonine protein kinase
VGVDNLATGVVVAERYRIERRLGRGGMGVVYAAHDTLLGRAVALKIVLDASPSADRFMREARAAAALGDPRIVTIFDVSTIDEHPTLIMELVDGHPLRAELTKPIPWRRALVILRDIAEGLATAHARGIVHRDLKPENVMVVAGDKVKLVDFGLARTIGADKLTDSSTFSGTPGYIAPEVALQGKSDAPSADVYAIGVIAFELLTAKMPFTAATPAALVLMHATKDAPRVAAVAPEANIPPSVDELVALLLSREPTTRPASAREVCAAIDRVLASQSIVPLEPTALTETSMAPTSVDSSATVRLTAPPTPSVMSSPRRRARGKRSVAIAALSVACFAAAGAASLAAIKHRGTSSRAERLGTLIAHARPLFRASALGAPCHAETTGTKILCIDEDGTTTELDTITGVRTPVILPGSGTLDGTGFLDDKRVLVLRNHELLKGERGSAAAVKIAGEVLDFAVNQALGRVAIADEKHLYVADEDGHELRTLFDQSKIDAAKVLPIAWVDDDTLLAWRSPGMEAVAVKDDGTITVVASGSDLDIFGSGFQGVFEGLVVVDKRRAPAEGSGTEMFATTLADAASGRAPQSVGVFPTSVVSFAVQSTGILVSRFERDVAFRTAKLGDDGRTLSAFETFPTEGNDERMPVFIGDGEIVYASERSGRWQIFSRKLSAPHDSLIIDRPGWVTTPTPFQGKLLFWQIDPATGAAELRVDGDDRVLLQSKQAVASLGWGRPGPQTVRTACGLARCALLAIDAGEAHVSTFDLSGRTHKIASLSASEQAHLAISADGANIAVVDNEESVTFIDAATSSIHARRVCERCLAQRVAFLPSGSAVIITTFDEEAKTTLLRVPIADGETTILAKTKGWAGEVAISPDGSRIIEPVWSAHYDVGFARFDEQ